MKKNVFDINRSKGTFVLCLSGVRDVINKMAYLKPGTLEKPSPQQLSNLH